MSLAIFVQIVLLFVVGIFCFILIPFFLGGLDFHFN